MPRFSNPQAPIANKAKLNSSRHNSVESNQYASLNLLDDDRSRLELILGLASPFDALAAVNYSSNRVIVDGESIITSLGKLDAAMSLDTGNIKTTAAALTGTVTALKDSVTVTVDAGTNIFTSSEAHGFTAGQPIRLKTTGSLPGGITTGTTYYVGSLGGSTFMLYTSAALATAGVAATEIDITSTGTGTHSLNGSYVLGTGTNFVLALDANDYIYIDDLASKIYQVSTIENDTTLVISSATATGDTSSVIRRLDTVAYPIIFTGLPRLKSDATNSEEPVRLGQINSSIGTALKRLISGPVPYYNDAASLILPTGFTCYDSTGTNLFTIASNQTVTLAASGANGLDTGAEASNTWYYVYLIGDSTGVNTPKGLLSVTNEAASGSVTLPSGYDKKRQLPLAIRNDGSSNQIAWIWVGRDLNSPLILYKTAMSVHAGGATTAGTTNVLAAGTSGTFANITCTSFIPPISRVGVFQALATFANACYTGLRTDAAFPEYMGGGPAGVATSHIIPTTSGQVIDYKRASGTGSISIDVMGYYPTEVN